MVNVKVSNFVIIRGDSSRRVGDGAPVFETTFTIPEPPPTVPALNPLVHSVITYMVKGLTVATTNPEIRINNSVVGQIQRARGADRNHWFTQTVTIASGNTFPIPLHTGTNELEIRAVSYPGAGGGDIFDDFFLRNIIVHYQILIPLGFL